MKSCNIDIRNFLPASFKGVSFPVHTVSDSGGRRGSVGEFPFSEHTDYIDLGVKTKTSRRFICQHQQEKVCVV